MFANVPVKPGQHGFVEADGTRSTHDYSVVTWIGGGRGYLALLRHAHTATETQMLGG